MSEATIETDPAAAFEAEQAERKVDRKRMKDIGGVHFVAVMGAITLWGAADAWATVSGWSIAQAVAIANAFIAAYITTSIVHEWGHLAGARLAGAKSPVHEKPVNYFFMFDFPFDANDTRQFVWMSWGGILAPWLLVVATLLFVPIDSISRATLLAVLAARAAAVVFFEVPITLRAARGGDPRVELGRQVAGGGLDSSFKLGWAVGAVVWLGIWLVI